MGWRDNLKEASFRGVTFRYSEVETTAGRRSVVHEFPLRDNPSVDDLARAPRKFTVTAYVIGTNEKGQGYMEQRDRLREAVEQEGPGDFQHPYWGKFLAVVDPASPVRIRESSAEGGMARFEIVFIAVEEMVLPEAEDDTASAVNSAADSLSSSAGDSFESTFDLDELPEDYHDPIREALDSLAAKVQEIKNLAAPFTSKLDELSQIVDDFAATVSSLLLLPAQLAAAIQDVMDSILGGITDMEAALSVTRSALGFGDTLAAVPLTTPQRIQQAAAQAALVQLFEAATVLAAGRLAAGFEFATREDAERARDELCARLSDLAEAAEGDAAGSYLDLRASIARHVAATSANLAVLRAYTPRQTLPDVVIAHELYGDASRAEEITARNKIRHPLFVQGGEPLEVIADA